MSDALLLMADAVLSLGMVVLAGLAIRLIDRTAERAHRWLQGKEEPRE